MMHKKIKKVLIVCPISVMRSTWCKHLLKYYPGRSFTVLHHPNKANRLANLKLDCEFYIINTDGIKIMEEELIHKKFDMIIIDESTSYSRHSSERTKVAWRLCRTVKSVIAMTGNPIPNDTIQSYAQAKLINFNRPRFFTKFRDQIKTKLDEFTYIDKDNAVDIAFSILQPCVRHKLEDCVDLPPIVYSTRDIPITKEQEKHYKSMEKDYITWLKTGESVTAANAAVKALKLLQISSGIIIKEDTVTGINHKHRVSELKQIISQTKKVIVFANFTHSINSLFEEFPYAKKIDGSVNERKRSATIDEFQEGDLRLLICQPAAISHGVTLTASDTIVWWGPCYSNEHFIQCNGRIRRPSQTKTQHIIMFRSTAIEKRVYKALNRKQSVSQSLLEMAE